MDGTGFETWQRVAVLVDGDNIRALHLDAVMTEAGRLGKVDVRRVYGNAVNCNGWDGFRIVHASGAKNAADMFLAVDAMRFAFEEEIRAFVIASSDGDFSPVAFALRERGADVVGVGEAKTGSKFRTACSRFVEVEAEKPEVPVLASMPELSTHHRDALNVIREEGGAALQVSMVTFGTRMGKVPQGRSSWRAILSERADLFVFVGSGKDARVRLTSVGAKVR
jgi:hypothetical protein